MFAAIGPLRWAVAGASVGMVIGLAADGDPAQARGLHRQRSGRPLAGRLVPERGGDVGVGDPLAGQAVEEPEGRQRLEDRRPHRVEVDRAGHDGEVDLVGRQLGCGDLADVQGLLGVLVFRRHPLPHVLLGAQHVGRAVALGDRKGGDLLAGGAPLNGLEDLLHSGNLLSGNSGAPSGRRALRVAVRQPLAWAPGDRWGRARRLGRPSRMPAIV